MKLYTAYDGLNAASQYLFLFIIYIYTIYLLFLPKVGECDSNCILSSKIKIYYKLNAMILEAITFQ